MSPFHCGAAPPEGNGRANSVSYNKFEKEPECEDRGEIDFWHLLAKLKSKLGVPVDIRKGMSPPRSIRIPRGTDGGLAGCPADSTEVNGTGEKTGSSPERPSGPAPGWPFRCLPQRVIARGPTARFR
jgi:hypothetical protein